MRKTNERIKQLRIEKNITQKKMAEILNIKEFSYQRFEYDSRPNLDNLITLADYFDVSVDYLLGRTDKREVNK